MSSSTMNSISKEYNTKRKLASCLNRSKFLKECCAEQVLPKSAPQQLKGKQHPFIKAARSYLGEAITKVRDDIFILKDELKGTSLPVHLRTKLNELNETQRTRLELKLKNLCKNSPWREARNVSIITR